MKCFFKKFADRQPENFWGKKAPTPQCHFCTVPDLNYNFVTLHRGYAPEFLEQPFDKAALSG